MATKPPKLKKCKASGCENKFTPFSSMEQWCSSACGYALSQEKLAKKEKSEKLANKKKRIAAKRAFNEKDKKFVEKRAKAYLHRWIKWRDQGLPCCACGNDMSHLPSRAVQASHYRPSGMNSAIRYDEINIHLGCSKCNLQMSGNLTEYRIRLIDKIGIEKVEWLESQNQVCKWSIDDLRLIRDDYAARLKALDIPLPSIS